MERRYAWVGMLIGLVLILSRDAAAQREYARVSPFTDLEVVGDVARVTYQDKTYELVSVEGVAIEKIIAFCRAEYERKWEERLATDLVEVMAALNKPIGPTARLVLRDAGTGNVTTVGRAVMTRENREAARQALMDRPWKRITPDQMREAVDALGTAMEQRWSYLAPSRFDHRPVLADVRQRIDRGITIGEFLVELQRIVAGGIDGHAEVRDWERFLPPGQLPFLVDSSGDRFVAFRPNRDGFLSDGHPYIESIDGRVIAEWLRAVSAFIADGSPQYVRQHGLRILRSIQFLRKKLGVPQGPDVESC
jgi:hypothetical protein